MENNYLIKPEMFVGKMNILIYGEPGAGKTYLAGTAQDNPDMKNVHFFNIDGGMMTLAERGDIEATNITSVAMLEEEFRMIVAGHPKYANVRTIVIDNITELQTLSLENMAFADLKSRIKNGNTVDDVYLEDYGRSGKQIARVLRGFRDLPMNVIYIAHKKDKMRQGTKLLEESRPSMTDKLGTALMGYMDFVWYLYTMDEVVGEAENPQYETHRYLLTQPMNNFAAKTRGTTFASKIGTIVRDPNLATLMAQYLSI